MYQLTFRRLVPIFFFSFLPISTSFGQSEICVGCSGNTETAEIIFSVNLEEFYIVVDNNYSDPYLLSDGDSIKFKKGSYNLRVIHPQINDVDFSVNLSGGEVQQRRIQVSYILASPQNSSYSRVLSYRLSDRDRSRETADSTGKSIITFSVDNEGFYTVIDQDYLNASKLIPGGSISLAQGEYEIRLVHPNFNDIIFYLDLRGNEQLDRRIILPRFQEEPSYSSYDLVQDYSNVEIITENEGEIYVDGEFSGSGKAVTFLKPGNHELKIIHPEYGELETEVNTGLYNSQLIKRFNKNPNLPFSLSNLIPGYSYYNSDRKRYAFTTWAAIGVLGGFALIQNNRYNAKLDEYNDLRERYSNALDRGQAETLASAARSKASQLDNINKLITYSVAGMALTYTFSTIHGILKPSSGFTSGSSDSGLTIGNGSSLTSFKIRYSF